MVEKGSWLSAQWGALILVEWKSDQEEKCQTPNWGAVGHHSVYSASCRQRCQRHVLPRSTEHPRF